MENVRADSKSFTKEESNNQRPTQNTAVISAFSFGDGGSMEVQNCVTTNISSSVAAGSNSVKAYDFGKSMNFKANETVTNIGESVVQSSASGAIIASDDEKIKHKIENKIYTFKNPGSVLIINNRFDDEDKGNKNPEYTGHMREGAEKDANDMRKLFQCVLGCSVTVKTNVASTELPGIITFFQDCVCKESDFSVVIFMSHGRENNTFLMDDLKTINLYKDLIYPFKHDRFPEFQGKPKIFLIQACDSASRLPEGDCIIEDDGEPDVTSGKKPVSREIADTFIGKPCLPFRKSWRNRDVGSWYIQAIDKIFREHWPSLDLETMHAMIEEQVIQMGNDLSDTHSVDVVQTPSIHKISFGRFKFPCF